MRNYFTPILLPNEILYLLIKKLSKDTAISFSELFSIYKLTINLLSDSL